MGSLLFCLFQGFSYMLFSDQLGLGLKIFLDRSLNDEHTKDESTKPEIRLIPDVMRSCRRLPSPQPAIF